MKIRRQLPNLGPLPEYIWRICDPPEAYFAFQPHRVRPEKAMVLAVEVQIAPATLGRGVVKIPERLSPLSEASGKASKLMADEGMKKRKRTVVRNMKLGIFPSCLEALWSGARSQDFSPSLTCCGTATVPGGCIGGGGDSRRWFFFLPINRKSWDWSNLCCGVNGYKFEER
ncbi:hypothetical protein Acr_29g0003810 [Actinidia rufa]|uniref:Uncharacterized protein n=1 Tax=Actinidia rufa TaxID=165716 RepID=A0A7J0HDR7_9ERIC|nr:hypothetical protein Acr_29g0003810 [Actinidia rufa]